jgi:hypothetical protein
MNGRIDAERILDAFLAPEADRLPDRVIDAALADIARTPQRRAMRVPWRFAHMPALTRATGIATVALVAAVGAGGLVYLNSAPSSGPGGPGSQVPPSPTVAPTTAPTTRPTTAPTPQPTWDPTAWKTYTSEVYGFTFSYPSDWSVHVQATEKGEKEVIANPESVDGDEIVFFVSQRPAPEGADLATWDGLEAAVRGICGETSGIPCPSTAPPTPMCVGQECQPAVIALVGDEQTPSAYIGDPVTGAVTVFDMGRPDDFPAAARYGGATALLKAIVAQIGVREPEPGETPH